MQEETPHITKLDRGYGLVFPIPDGKEYQDMKNNMKTISHENFTGLAKKIFETFNLETKHFPQLRFSEEGELTGIQLGTECACVELDHRGYHFHNVGDHKEALAALQILAKYTDYLRMP